MLDHFALLGLTPRPWLDPEELRDTFQRLAADQHPDAAHGSTADFTALNAAYTLLRDPAARLRHLLQLEFGGDPPSRKSVPPGIAELFPGIAALQQRAGEILVRHTAAVSPLARALLAGERGEASRELTFMLAQLERLFALLDDCARALDAEWDARHEATVAQVADIAQSYTYLQRWRDQLSETRTRLSL